MTVGADSERPGVPAPTGRPLLPAGSGVIGDRRDVAAGPAGDIHRLAARAYRQRVGGLLGVGWPAVTGRPQLHAGSSVIGHRCVVGIGARPAGTGHEDPAAVRAHRNSRWEIGAAARTVVASEPETSPGHGVVGEGDEDSARILPQDVYRYE